MAPFFLPQAGGGVSQPQGSVALNGALPFGLSQREAGKRYLHTRLQTPKDDPGIACPAPTTPQHLPGAVATRQPYQDQKLLQTCPLYTSNRSESHTPTATRLQW